MNEPLTTLDLSRLFSGLQWSDGWTATSILLAGLLGSLVLNRICDRRLTKMFPSSSPAARALVGRIVFFVVLAIAGLLALKAIGLPISRLLTTGTVLFVGLGLAVQKILQSLVAGTLLLIEREIEPGDIIRFNGEEHRVKKVGIRTTELESRNRETLILPNYILATSPLVNLTHRAQSVRLSMPVQVMYGSDMDAVELALSRAATSIKGRTTETPQILLTGLGSHGVDWRIRVEIDDPWELNTCRSALGKRVLEELAAANLSIPFPQLDVHLPANQTA